ncbi:MAG: lysylphosphatidylglycerol synthase transmembrane domain-containing protein, partial [Chloroflexota bacterium]|nr:lysylphosphatidylglycerol synthase transmembrane domain-containing protein [Chloroflexota bacterium]
QLINLPKASTFVELGNLAAWAVAIFLVGLAVFILVAMFPEPASKLIHSLINRIIPERWRAPLINIADRFLEGLMSLRSPADALMIFLTSILIWILETGLYWSVNQAMGLNLNFGQLMLLNGVVNLVLLIPAAPGGLGTFDAAGRAILEAFGIASEPALGYTLVLRIALWVPITLLGTIYFFREGLKWTMDADEMESQAKDLPPKTIEEDNHEQ